jgi:hypothetical protein
MGLFYHFNWPSAKVVHMSKANDVVSLFRRFGGDPSTYQDIVPAIIANSPASSLPAIPAAAKVDVEAIIDQAKHINDRAELDEMQAALSSVSASMAHIPADEPPISAVKPQVTVPSVNQPAPTPALSVSGGNLSQMFGRLANPHTLATDTKPEAPPNNINPQGIKW